MTEIFSMFAGGALVGTIAACWSYIKGIFYQISSLFIQHIELRPDISYVVLEYLLQTYKLSRIYDKTYDANMEYVRADDKEYYARVPYELFSEKRLVLWRGWLPLLIKENKKAVNTGGNVGGTNGSNTTEISMGLSITFFRYTFNIDDIVVKATQAYSDRIKHINMGISTTKRFFINHVPHIKNAGKKAESRGYLSNLPWYQSSMYKPLLYRVDDIGLRPDVDHPALARLIFPKNIMALIEEIRVWKENETWYKEHDIPWKRGWSLYGPPGSGKTALARAFAEDLDIPIFVYNLAQLDNTQFTEAWHAMRTHTPCIALIEDIDTVFHGRKNISPPPIMPFSMSMFKPHNPLAVDPIKPGDEEENTPRGLLTFECLINQIDGIERGDGIFTIITTNDISKVDEALGKPVVREDGTTEFMSTRPGRIDNAIELSYMSPECKHEMAKRILSEYVDELQAIRREIDSHPDLKETPAQFQNKCGQIALRCFWKETNK